jgi:ferric-dicitrate binding protein FerR (iron transport regulator)
MAELNDIWNSGKGKLPEDKLMAYLEGKLSPEEQHEVEAWLAEEGMESDAVEGLKELPASETCKTVNKLNYQLRSALGKKPRRTKAIAKNEWAWLAIILILLLCIAGYAVLHFMLKK